MCPRTQVGSLLNWPLPDVSWKVIETLYEDQILKAGNFAIKFFSPNLGTHNLCLALKKKKKKERKKEKFTKEKIQHF